MEKLPPPLLGFNNNVRHRGRMFHIQTEDSGVKHARIVTHLFADGGRILRTARTDYTDKLGHRDMAELLRRVMKQQHKAMFLALRAGEFDTAIGAALGPESTGTGERADGGGLAHGRPSPPTDGTKRSAPGPDDTIPIVTERAPDRAAASASEGESASRRRPSGTHEKAPPLRGSSDGVRTASLFEIPMAGSTLFSEGVLSERSLDDTILSYLEDEEGAPPSER